MIQLLNNILRSEGETNNMGGMVPYVSGTELGLAFGDPIDGISLRNDLHELRDSIYVSWQCKLLKQCDLIKKKKINEERSLSIVTHVRLVHAGMTHPNYLGLG